MDTELDALLERPHTFSAFANYARHLGTSADLTAVVALAQRTMTDSSVRAVTIFDDATGDYTEVEPHGSADSVRSRLVPPEEQQRRLGPGRPRLGVVSREVSLLPRHWEWLSAQPGGASAALRRLIDQARKRSRAQDGARIARDAVARVMSALAGDRSGYEEALRALYRGEFSRIPELTATWPEELRTYVLRLVATAAALHALGQQEAAASAPPAPADSVRQSSAGRDGENGGAQGAVSA